MFGKNYSLHTRTTQKGKKIYYVQFRLPSGKWGTPRSTGESAKSRAEAWAIAYLNKGQNIINNNLTLREFAGTDFFIYGNEWEKNKHISGKKPPSPRWCMERSDMLRNHILPHLGDYRLTLITDEVITSFRNGLYMGKFGRKYSGSFINKILFALRDIMKTAYKKQLIQVIPEFELAGVNEKQRGRLTRSEASQIFAFKWNDDRAYIASLISAATGMRLSEIQGLKISDIKIDGSIIICKMWDRRTRTIKLNTKNGKTRKVQLQKDILIKILNYITEHPYKDSDSFLLYSDKSHKIPASDTILMRPFHHALEKIGITKNIREERGICFHSWRYFCNSILIESGIPAETVRELIGHCADGSMTQRYFRSENLENVLHAIETALPLSLSDKEDGAVIN